MKKLTWIVRVYITFCLLIVPASSFADGYYTVSHGSVQRVENADPNQVSAHEWQVRLYKANQATSGDGYWALISGTSAADVMQKLKARQEFELNFNQAIGKGRVQDDDLTNFNPLGPIAVLDDDSSQKTALNERDGFLQTAIDNAKDFIQTYQTMRNVIRMPGLLEWGAEFPNRYRDVGRTVKEYADLIKLIERKYADLRKDLDNGLSVNLDDIDGSMSDFNSAENKLESATNALNDAAQAIIKSSEPQTIIPATNDKADPEKEGEYLNVPITGEPTIVKMKLSEFAGEYSGSVASKRLDEYYIARDTNQNLKSQHQAELALCEKSVPIMENWMASHLSSSEIAAVIFKCQVYANSIRSVLKGLLMGSEMNNAERDLARSRIDDLNSAIQRLSSLPLRAASRKIIPAPKPNPNVLPLKRAAGQLYTLTTKADKLERSPQGKQFQEAFPTTSDIAVSDYRIQTEYQSMLGGIDTCPTSLRSAHFTSQSHAQSPPLPRGMTSVARIGGISAIRTVYTPSDVITRITVLKYGRLYISLKSRDTWVYEGTTRPRKVMFSTDLLEQRMYFKGDGDQESLAEADRSAKGHEEAGDALYTKGKYSEAVIEHKQALLSDSPDTRAPFALGLDLSAEWGFSQAEQYFRMARDMYPKVSVYQNFYANNLYHEGKYPEAEAEFRKACLLDPTNMYFISRVADALRMQQRYAEAETLYRQAIKGQPDIAVYHETLGYDLQNQSRLSEAVAEYQEAVRLDPKNQDYKSSLSKAIAITSNPMPTPPVSQTAPVSVTPAPASASVSGRGGTSSDDSANDWRTGVAAENIDSGLIDKIRELVSDGHKVQQLALGSNHAWLLLTVKNERQYCNWHNISQGMADQINKAGYIHSMAISPSGGWVVQDDSHVYTDGLPDSLIKQIKDANKGMRERIFNIYFASNGSWYVRSNLTMYWSEGWPDDFYQKCNAKADENIISVTCGPNGAWVVQTDKNLYWNGIPQTMADQLVRAYKEKRKHLLICLSPDGGWIFTMDRKK